MLVTVLAVVASLLWWDGTGRLITPDRGTDVQSAAVTALVVQSAARQAIVAHWQPPRHGPAPLSYQVRVVTLDGRATVATAQTPTRSAVVGGLAPGGRYRVVVATAPHAASAMSGPVTVLADQPPNAPDAVSVRQLTTTNAIEVRWTPAAGGVAATGAIVQLYDGPAYTGYLTCQAECTTATIRGLLYGHHYGVRIAPVNAVGEGAATESASVELRNPCPTVAACVAIDAATATGPARQRAMGFLNSLYPVGDMAARLQALTPSAWRGAPNYQPATGTLDWSSWDVAVASGAQTTLLLSNLWDAETDPGTGAKTPWSDFAGYGRWVTATIRSINASGHRVSYWEIQNEPGGTGYFSAADFAAATPADYLEQFRVAYRAITAADPSAAIVGPSLSHFSDYPGEYDSNEPDLVTFLDFAARNNMHFAAVTWHEIDDDLGPRPRDFNSLPEAVIDHVAEVRRLIAERPGLGAPEVWVNEYGHRMDYAIPGWTLGTITALERAGLDRAGRSCWAEQSPSGAPVDDCAAPTLDGLLLADGSTPRANYLVYATYARMTGHLVAASASDAAVAVLAARNDASGQVTAMVGRDVTCLPAMNASCPRRAAVVPAPEPAVVAIHLPGGAGSQAVVSVVQVPPGWGAAVPVTMFQGALAVSAGVVKVPLAALADGEVYIITVRRR